MMKKEKICKKKECKRLAKDHEMLLNCYSSRGFEIQQLKNQLQQKQQQEDQSRSSAALAARTELIKALGCAMKTCSSIAWSDRKNPYFDRT
jgi:hypothetical protein